MSILQAANGDLLHVARHAVSGGAEVRLPDRRRAQARTGGRVPLLAAFDFTLANIYFQQEQLDPGAAAYERAVAEFPKFERAWKNLGRTHVRNGEFTKALPALTRVLELGGGAALTYGLLGFAYSSGENYLSTESAYRIAILLDPDTLDWKMPLARSLFKRERYADAVALCEGLIASDPVLTQEPVAQDDKHLRPRVRSFVAMHGLPSPGVGVEETFEKSPFYHRNRLDHPWS